MLLEHYAIPTSKFHDEFHKSPQNMKQNGLDAVYLSRISDQKGRFRHPLRQQRKIALFILKLPQVMNFNCHT